jgi:hypothetical protein
MTSLSIGGTSIATGGLVAESSVSLPAKGHLARFVTEFGWSEPIDFSHFEGVLRVVGPNVAATVIQTRPGQLATMPVARW